MDARRQRGQASSQSRSRPKDSGRPHTLTSPTASATAATQAKLFKSVKPGVRGDAILDLKVSGGTTGTITGQLTLTPQQVTEVSASRYYVQLYSEKAAEGNLWGWLMPQQEKAR